MSGCSKNSRFFGYYAWSESAHDALSIVADSSAAPLFPCSLPYPEALYSEGAISGFSSRTMWARRYLNAFVAWSNYVELGCPDCRERVCEPPVAYQSEAFARRFADRWLGEVEEFGSLDLLSGTLELQGGRFAVKQAFDSVKCAAAGYEAGANLSGASEVQVDRVAIPSSQPSLTFLRIANSDFSSVTPTGWPAVTTFPNKPFAWLARPRRTFFGKQRGREASSKGQRSFQDGPRRHGPASQDPEARLRRRHRRVLRGWRSFLKSGSNRSQRRRRWIPPPPS